MSTKSTIWYSDDHPDWHFYTEVFDSWSGEDNVYIEFPRDALKELDTVCIPTDIWKQMMTAFAAQPGNKGG